MQVVLEMKIIHEVMTVSMKCVFLCELHTEEHNLTTISMWIVTVSSPPEGAMTPHILQQAETCSQDASEEECRFSNSIMSS